MGQVISISYRELRRLPFVQDNDMTDKEIEFYVERIGMIMSDGVPVLEAERRAAGLFYDYRRKHGISRQ